MHIREEAEGEGPTIRALTDAAFAGVAYSDGNEGAIVDALRADGALHLSLVALEGDDILGHVAFSPVRVSETASGWYGLGPVAVAVPHQRRGIGRALILEGLNRLRQEGAKGAVVLGDPAYYGRFGFEAVAGIWYSSGPSPYFQRLVLAGPEAQGQVTYAAAFGDS